MDISTKLGKMQVAIYFWTSVSQAKANSLIFTALKSQGTKIIHSVVTMHL